MGQGLSRIAALWLALGGAAYAADRIGYGSFPVRDTGILFPKLTRFRDPSVLAAVNTEIDRLTSGLGCAPGATRGAFSVDARVTLAAADVFSIYAPARFDCGLGKSANNANFSITFDLRTGRRLRFEDLFAHYGKDKRDILSLLFASELERARSLEDSEKTMSQRRRVLGKTFQDEDRGSCVPEYTIEHLAASTYRFHLTKRELGAQPVWPQAIETCADTVTLPIEKLKRFAAPGSPLVRLK